MSVFRKIFFILTLAASFIAVNGSGSAQSTFPELLQKQRVFSSGKDVKLTLPTGVRGVWVILDDAGRKLRDGEFAKGEKILYLPGFESGIYYLYWNIDLTGPASASVGPQNRLSFLILPRTGNLSVDDYFAVNQVGMVRGARNAQTLKQTDYAFVLNALGYMGIHRLRTGFERDLVFSGQTSGKADWGLVDRIILRDSPVRGLRFIAQIEGNTTPATPQMHPPRDPKLGADYLGLMADRYKMKVDIYSLWAEPNGTTFPGTARHFVDQIAPWYDKLKVRAPLSLVTLGGIAADPQNVTQPANPEFLHEVFLHGAPYFDLLDHPADGTFAEARKMKEAVDKLLEGTPSETKPRAISTAAFPSARGSIDDERLQARELVKKLAWFRHFGYRFFAAASLLDDPAATTPRAVTTPIIPAGSGFFMRGATPDERRPRMQTHAWIETFIRLNSASAVMELKHANEFLEIYGFKRKNETVLVAWVPDRLDDVRAEKRVAATIQWPVGSRVKLFDMLGHDVTETRLKPRVGPLNYVMLNLEPLFVEISAAPGKVAW